MNKESNLIFEAYQKVVENNEQNINGQFNPMHRNYKPEPGEEGSELEHMPATHGEQGYNEEEITYDQLVAYNNDYDIEDVFDMIYKGVNSGQISYDTYTKFMRTVIE